MCSLSFSQTPSSLSFLLKKVAPYIKLSFLSSCQTDLVLTELFICGVEGMFSFSLSNNKLICSNHSFWPLVFVLLPFPFFLFFSPSSSPCSLQMDVVYTFQTGQTAVPGALRRQPSVVSQQNDAKTVSSPTHVGISSSSLSANSAAAAGPPAPASSSTTGSECHITQTSTAIAWWPFWMLSWPAC